MWHWATPATPPVPWDRLRGSRWRRRPWPPSTGRSPRTPARSRALSEDPPTRRRCTPAFLAHFDRDGEVFVALGTRRREALDGRPTSTRSTPGTSGPLGLHDPLVRGAQARGDPRRPARGSYGSVLEFGCSIGVLTEELGAAQRPAARHRHRRGRGRAARAPDGGPRATCGSAGTIWRRGCRPGDRSTSWSSRRSAYYLDRPGLDRFARG